jgi:inorganic pyrophosphatase
VGDIAGMGADLFGSFAESTCAALVVSAALLKKKEEGIIITIYHKERLIYLFLLTL